MRTLLFVALGLALLGTTGCAPASPARAQAACGDVRWGGYEGDPRCAALAQRTIRGADRACTIDADCTLIHPGASCREQAAAAAHVATYRALPAACTHPAGGPCNPAHASCEHGCCVAR